MEHRGRRRAGRRPSRAARLSSAAAIGLVVCLGPGVAGADPGGSAVDRSHPPDVVPLVDCVLTHADGSWTAVFGYDNRTGAPVDIPVGPANQVTPRSAVQPQPTTFAAGIRHGVFTVTVPRGGGPMWHLGDTNLAARRTGATCPDPTQMPAEGNGAGTAVVVAAAAGAGAVLVRRWRRRAVAAPRPGVALPDPHAPGRPSRAGRAGRGGPARS